jgi:hypothetical protein
MDCGATCLRMVAKHYGKSYSLADLRQITHTTREGASLLGLSDAAEIEYTPTVFINRKQLPGTFNLEDVRDLF